MTSTRMKKSWLESIPKKVGETVYISHDECGDTRNRLAITNKGAVALAWCHNCQRSGIHSAHGYNPSMTVKEYIAANTSTIDVDEVKLPDVASDRVTVLKNFPEPARQWLEQYEIEQSELDITGIYYSPSQKRVILPIYFGGVPVSYQARAIFPNQKPKYLSVVGKEKHIPFRMRQLTDVCVLTEDMLSAIKVGRMFDSMALSGVHLHDKMLDKLVETGYTDVVVWLDNDNPQVQAAQKKIVNRLDGLTRVHLVDDMAGVDPKECSNSVIKFVVERYIK